MVLIHGKDVFFYLCNVSKWLFILNQHLGELKALLWTDPHHVPKQEDPVWSVAHLQGQHMFKHNISASELCHSYDGAI